jgi:hypothetical protein
MPAVAVAVVKQRESNLLAVLAVAVLDNST